MDLIKINTTSVFCAGDLHGNFGSITNTIKAFDLKDCTIIICGDIGIGFNQPEYYTQQFNKIKKVLSKRNIYLLLLRGNHDDPAEFNGNTYKKDKRIKTLRDYTVIQFYSANDIEQMGETFNVLAIGGAISIDRMHRMGITERNAFRYMKYNPGVDYDEAYRKCPQCYWTDEMPVFNKEAFDEIKNCGINIDAVATHTCPDFCKPLTKDGISYWMHLDKCLNADTDYERQIMSNIYYRLKEDNHLINTWCYGHYHWHNFDYIDGIKYYTLDMERNGRMDMAEIKNFDAE